MAIFRSRVQIEGYSPHDGPPVNPGSFIPVEWDTIEQFAATVHAAVDALLEPIESNTLLLQAARAAVEPAP